MCKNKVYPPFDNFADFIYGEQIKNKTEISLIGFDVLRGTWHNDKY